MKDFIYLDSAATSKLHPNALKEMINVWENWANPSAMHQMGRKNYFLLESLRNEIREIFNIKNNAHIIFTSCATEANNLVFHSTNLSILCSKFEHPSVLKFPSVEVINLDELEEKLKKKEYLVSLMLVNNETGFIVANQKLIEMIKKYGSKVHVDASQAKNIDFDSLGCDYLTISSHKIGGPIGVAVLITKTLLKPMLFGGGQEYQMRSGTEMLPLIAGFVAACRELKNYDYLKLYQKLKQKIDKKYFLETFIEGEFVKHIICLLTYKFSGTEVLAFMDLNNIAVSYGSACSSGTLNNIEFLKHFNLPSENAIRISLGWQNNEKEIDYFIEKFYQMLEV